MSDVVRCVCGQEFPTTGAPAACSACGADLAGYDATLPPMSSSSLSADTQPANGSADAAPLAAVPGYEVLREVGRGGMGVVYEARQLSLGRVVALKMILAGAHAGASELSRFRTEAQAIARLQHPNIVQIHEVGAHEGRPYFCLEFCAGGSLEKKLRGTPLPPEQAAVLIETLARAIHAAHQKGIIHRDLKPANVLLAEDGGPRITDFGLAKALDPASSGGETAAGLTASHAVMGTPSYMAPEQAAGQARNLGPACDVYALGAILYECLTGRPPFRAATPMDTLLQVMREEPAAPSRLNPTVPRDLETIALKCLAKAPTKRYASALELADDLARWQRHEPIHARRLSAWERSVRWVRRHRLVTAVIVQTAVLIIALIGAFAYNQVRETNRARQSLKQVQAEREQARDALARGHYEQARALLRSREPGRRHAALDLLAKAEALRGRQRESDVMDPNVQPPSRAELRREAAAALLTEDAREVGKINASFPIGLFSEVAPDVSWLMTAYAKQFGSLTERPQAGLRLFDLRDGRKLAEIERFDFITAKTLAVSPDAKSIALMNAAGAVQIIEFPSGKPLQSLTRPPLPNDLKTLRGANRHFLSFSADGRLLICGDCASKESDVFVWNLKEPAKSRHVARVPTFIESVAIRPDGGAVAIPRGGSLVGIWDLTRPDAPVEIDVKFPVEALPNRTSYGFAHTALVWSADGARLAVGAKVSDKLQVFVWDAAARVERLRWESPFPGESVALAFAPDGQRLAVGDAVGAVHCLDLTYGQEAWALEGVFPSGIHMLKWQADGRLVIGSMLANHVRVWEPSGERFERPLGSGGAAGGMVFGSDGKWLAVHGGGKEPVIHFVPVADGERAWTLPVPSEAVQTRSLHFQPARRELAVFCKGTAVIFEIDRRREARRVALPVTAPLASKAEEARFLPDGRIVSAESEAGGKGGRRVTVRERPSGKEIGPSMDFPKGQGPIPFGDWRIYRVSDDGRLLSASPFPGMPSSEPVTIWKIETGEKLAAIPSDESVMSMQAHFSPDARWFLRMILPFSYDTGATKSSDMRFTLWEVATGRRQWEIACPFPPNAAEFSDDGRLLAVGYEYGGVDLYDVQTGEQLFRWSPPGLRDAQRLAFSPDGRYLAVSGKPGPIRLLHLADLRQRLAELGLDW